MLCTEEGEQNIYVICVCFFLPHDKILDWHNAVLLLLLNSVQLLKQLCHDLVVYCSERHYIVLGLHVCTLFGFVISTIIIINMYSSPDTSTLLYNYMLL